MFKSRNLYLSWFDFYKEWKSVRLELLTSIVTFSMEWLYLMKWSYKKFLYLRLELFRILNEWLRKRPFTLWDVSPTYWAPQPLASHVITYIKFELFQSTSLSIWMPYLLPLMEDVIVDLHEIWWHVKHLLALHMDILENLLLAEYTIYD